MRVPAQIAVCQYVVACVAGLASASLSGVGVELTLDYGVVSAYFANHTYADIARVEGSPSYRRELRLPTARYRHEPETVYKKQTVVATGFRDYLPPWLGGAKPKDNALTPMIKTLHAAAESFLEHSVSEVEIVFPWEASESLRHATRDAAASLSLTLSKSSHLPAGSYTLWAHDLVQFCDETNASSCPPERMVLALEYTRAALSGVLVLVDDLTLETQRAVHEPLLGTDALASRCAPDQPGECVRDLESALRELIHLPFSDGSNGDQIRYVSELVLHGELASDIWLEEALKNALGEQYVDTVKVTGPQRANHVPPLFAASRGVALDCWSRSDDGFRDFHSELR